MIPAPALLHPAAPSPWAAEIAERPLPPHDQAWRNTLLDSLALIEAEMFDEMQSAHPGARWRVADLLARALDRRRQLAGLAR